MVPRFYPRSDHAAGAVAVDYAARDELTHTVFKVETHNHPTAISPFPGASTGAGGEIRDEGATGRGAKPKAGLCGFSVSNLRLPDMRLPWENDADVTRPGDAHGTDFGFPGRIADALAIMIEGPIGAAAFNNEFGRPNLVGYFRAYEQNVGGRRYGYHKPIMIAGGVGSIRDDQVRKLDLPPGTLLVQLGGPGMRIGLGGGAASSMGAGTNTEQLDFDSVQRGNPEIERRAQEVIDRCWALGDGNPVLSIHDVGAGGLSNAFPELADQSRRGARIALDRIPVEESGMSPLEIWCNESQERYALALCARAPACLRVAVPAGALPLLGHRRSRRGRQSRRRPPGHDARGRHADGRAARQAAAHAPRRAAGTGGPARLRDRRAVSRPVRARRAPSPDGRVQELPRHDRRPHRRWHERT